MPPYADVSTRYVVHPSLLDLLVLLELLELLELLDRETSSSATLLSEGSSDECDMLTSLAPSSV